MHLHTALRLLGRLVPKQRPATTRRLATTTRRAPEYRPAGASPSAASRSDLWRSYRANGRGSCKLFEAIDVNGSGSLSPLEVATLCGTQTRQMHVLCAQRFVRVERGAGVLLHISAKPWRISSPNGPVLHRCRASSSPSTAPGLTRRAGTKRLSCMGMIRGRVAATPRLPRGFSDESEPDPAVGCRAGQRDRVARAGGHVRGPRAVFGGIPQVARRRDEVCARDRRHRPRDVPGRRGERHEGVVRHQRVEHVPGPAAHAVRRARRGRHARRRARGGGPEDPALSRRGYFRRRVAAAPRTRRGYSAETNRGGAADATWIFRAETSGGDAAAATWTVRSTSTRLRYTNVGNPHSVGQKPLTFFRQVLALCDLPEENGVDHPAASSLFPSDAVDRAREARAAVGAAGTGSYTNSQGVAAFRQDVADFIEKRDGHAARPEDVFLTNGASSAIQHARGPRGRVAAAPRWGPGHGGAAVGTGSRRHRGGAARPINRRRSSRRRSPRTTTR